MKVREFNEYRRFSEASGVISYISKDFNIGLNDLGIYEEYTRLPLDSDVSEMVLKVSPNFNDSTDEGKIAEMLFSNVEGINHDDSLGYYLSTYVGHASEGNIRETGSSGGLGTWILLELKRKGLVDSVIHVKKGSKGSGKLFEYGISSTEEEILQGAKTRYYPVELSQVLEYVSQNPGKYAVVGIPSFIYSIRLLQEVDPVIKDRIVYMVGLICGHQKSSKFGEYLAWQMGFIPGSVSDIDFRKKYPDKNADDYGIEVRGIIDNDEIVRTSPMSELDARNWGEGYFKVYASDFNDDVANETADITLGDAWLPDYTKDSGGNNVVVVRNPEIESLLRNAMSEGRISLEEVDKSVVIKSQKSHFRHTRNELGYRLSLAKKDSSWTPIKRNFDSSMDFIRKNIQKVRLDLSTRSHTAYKEAVADNSIEKFQETMEPLKKRYKRLYLLLLLKNNGISNIVKSIGRKMGIKGR